MKQVDMFGNDNEIKEESAYTSSIVLPIYEPKNKCPNIFELADTSKSSRLINEINNSLLPGEEKRFLIG